MFDYNTWILRPLSIICSILMGYVLRIVHELEIETINMNNQRRRK